MTFVDIGRSGYRFWDQSRLHSFSVDETHSELLDYITKDLSSLPHLLEKHIAKRMDLCTLEPTGRDSRDDEILQIQDILFSAHPYYRHEYKQVIMKAIGDYFNHLLVHLTIAKQNNTFLKSIDEEWYFERFSLLIPPSLLNGRIHPDGAIVDKFFFEYRKWIGEPITHKPDPLEEIFVYAPRQKPTGFIEEILTQKYVFDMLYYILDIAAQDINTLSTPQRVWLYQKMFHSSADRLEIGATKKSLFYSAECDNHHDIFPHLHEQECTNSEFTASDLREELLSAIEYAKSNSPSEFYEEYMIENIRQLLYLEVLSMIQTNTVIRKCRNCGKYFVVKNRNIAYCERLDESGKRCSDVGSTRSFQRKMSEEE